MDIAEFLITLHAFSKPETPEEMEERERIKRELSKRFQEGTINPHDIFDGIIKNKGRT